MAVAELLRSLKNVTSDNALSITASLNAKLKGTPRVCMHVFATHSSLDEHIVLQCVNNKTVWMLVFDADILNAKNHW